jgi:hypothetical protein
MKNNYDNLVYNRKYQLNLNIPGSNLENLSITPFTYKCIVYVRHRSIHYMESVLHYRSCSSLPLVVCILLHDYICDLHPLSQSLQSTFSLDDLLLFKNTFLESCLKGIP